MKQPLLKPLALLMLASGVLTLTACGGDATTTINELEPVAEDDDHDHDHGDAAGGGRLLVLKPNEVQAEVFDLADNDSLATIDLDALPSAVYASPGYRYGVLIERNEDRVGFVDGGLWQEPHDDHFDVFTATPSLTNFTLSGSTPTHYVPHEDKAALFLDGDAQSGASAGVLVFEDHTIEEGETPISLDLTTPFHGVAEPREDDLIVSVRRDDSLTTSSNPILPDQIALYRLDNDEYAMVETFDVTCADLHGAAQNEDYIAFGCSDGVVVVADNGDGSYSASKLDNPDDLIDGLRVSTIWGHHESGQFIAQARSRDIDDTQFFAIDPEEGELELIDWQPSADASPIARGFAFEAEQFVILDSQGFLTVIEPHDEGGHTHWEFGERLDITDADVSTMPDGFNFTLALSPIAHQAFIADPIEQHVLVVDLEMLMVTGDIELDYVPGSLTWLGIVEEHEH